MKRVLVAVCIIAQFGLSQVAQATTVSINDTSIIWSGWSNNVVGSNGWAQNDTDSIGSPQTITTTFDLSNGLLNSITFDVLYPLPTNVFAGDLFINLLTNSNDTTWDYVVNSLNGSDGTYDIRQVSVDAVKNPNLNPYVMSYYDSDPANYRSLHPIGVQSQYLGADVGDATLSGLNTNYIKYDFGNGFDLDGKSFIIGWTQTCANDVIYQPVPEPGTMMLLGMGMLGLAVYGKRRMNKNS